ncbi:hypothetical protein BDW66DRAFT_130137 [Aspergillus desertorum]
MGLELGRVQPVAGAHGSRQADEGNSGRRAQTPASSRSNTGTLSFGGLAAIYIICRAFFILLIYCQRIGEVKAHKHLSIS